MSVRFSQVFNSDINIRRFDVFVSLVALLAFTHRVLYEYKFEVWIDEQYTQGFSQWGVIRLLTEFPTIQPHLPAFYLLLKFWGSIFNYEVVVLRIVPVVSMTLTIPIGAYFARELWDDRAGLYTALVLACSPWLIYLSRLLRMYGTMFALSLFLLYVSHRACRDENARETHYALLSVALMWLHYFGILSVAASLYIRFRTGHSKRVLYQAAILGVAFAPILLIIWMKVEPSGVGGTVNQVTHIQTPPNGAVLLDSANRVLGFIPQSWFGILRLLLAWTLLGIGIAVYPSKRWAVWVLFPVLGVVIISYTIHPAYNTRYLAAATPPLFLWMARGLAELDNRYVTLAFILSTEPIYFVLTHYFDIPL